MKKRDFLKSTAILASTTLMPSSIIASVTPKNLKLKTAHIGVGGMGKADLNDIASHKKVEVYALCDVDNKALVEAGKLFPNAKLFKDYRKMLENIRSDAS